MIGVNQTGPSVLTQADADWLIDQLFHICPGVECDLQRMERAGLPNPRAAEEFARLKEIILGILREYFPDRLSANG